jgi:hypothetical protein
MKDIDAPFKKAGRLARKILGAGCENDITRAVDRVIDVQIDAETRALTGEQKTLLRRSRKASVKARAYYAKIIKDIYYLDTSHSILEAFEEAIAVCDRGLALPTRGPREKALKPIEHAAVAEARRLLLKRDRKPVDTQGGEWDRLAVILTDAARDAAVQSRRNAKSLRHYLQPPRWKRGIKRKAATK